MTGRFGIIPIWFISKFMAIFENKWEKQSEQGIFRPNRYAMAHSFRVGLGYEIVVGKKLIEVCQGVGHHTSVVSVNIHGHLGG